MSDGDVQQAIHLFFETDGADLESSPVPHNVAPHAETTGIMQHEPITVDDDIVIDEFEDNFEVALQTSRLANQSTLPGGDPVPTTPGPTKASNLDADEAMARRLQEEFYSDMNELQETNGVRAPIAKTRETLVGPEDDYLGQIDSQLRRGSRRTASMFSDYLFSPLCILTAFTGGRPGTFNQRPPTSSAWGDAGSARLRLAEATGGDSERSAKQRSLSEMYRLPYEIMEHLSFDDAREQAKETKKWILVNIQDASIFDSQILNRDIWKSKTVQETIKESFLFLQYDKSGMDGQMYVRLYFPHAINVPPTSELNPFPIIAIVDPRTGEQVKVWTEAPKEPLDFVMQLHEFLDRYSLDNTAKNPVQRRNQTKQKLDIDHMTEEEMLDLATRNSLNDNEECSTLMHDDPDALTREQKVAHQKDKGKQLEENNLIELNGNDLTTLPSTPKQSSFQKIPQKIHHIEPRMGPGITAIKFKLADGSHVVRRFALTDKVVRIYEWIKADLLPQQAAQGGEDIADKQFELVSMSKNLIDDLDSTLEEAGLKQRTVMIEFVDNE